MDSALHLQQRHRRVIENLARQHLPGVDIWAYGSRVNGQSHDGSDLDLVLRGPNLAEIPFLQVGAFWEALQESTLPFLVEARDWACLPERFHDEIQRNYVALVSAESRWRYVTLGDCIEMNDATYAPKEDWPFINYLDTGNLTEGRIDAIQHLVTGEDKIPSRARRKVKPGDVLYSTVRPNQRHFGIMKNVPENFLASTGFAVIRGKARCAHTDFIYRFLAQDSVVEHLHTVAEHSASAYPSIRPADIEQLRLRLPPLAEQRAMAQVLGALDDKIELNRRMAKTLDESGRALFKSWFSDSDAPRPLASLNEYAWLNPESWSAINRPDNVAYVDLSNTKWGTIEKIESYRWDDAPGRARRVLRSGDTIVGTVRPGNGSFALVGKEGLTASTGFAVLRPKADYDAQFVWFAVTSKANIERLARLADGGAYPAVSARAVADTIVVRADSDARRKFSNLTAPLVAKRHAVSDESEALATLRDNLLPQLISGGIRIQDVEELVEAAV